MIEQAGCEWCETWDNEIGGIYNKTEESQKARLVRHDIDEIATLGYNLVSNIRYTPTFIVLEDNREIGRITGYPGEESFWPMLNSILDQLNQ